MDDLLQALVPPDDPDARALGSAIAALPEHRRDVLTATMVRVLVTYERGGDPQVLTGFLASLRLSLRLHAADPGYAEALDRAERPSHGREVSRDEVAALLTRT